MSDKIVDFNAVKAKMEEEKFDEIVSEQEELDYNITALATDLTIDIADALHSYGYNVIDNSKGHDLMMVVEAIRSLAYRTVDVDYPLHKVSESAFEIEDEEDFRYNLLDGLGID